MERVKIAVERLPVMGVLLMLKFNIRRTLTGSVEKH